MLKLTNIYIYPIKSLGGIELTSAVAEERGLQYDRRWMLVDDEGVFMSQRKHPKMALFKTSIKNGYLLITAHDDSTIEIHMDSALNSSVPVTVWGTECNGYLVGNDYNKWFSDKLGAKCRLVFMGNHERHIESNKMEKVSYADGYPFLILGQSSLDDLNSRLDETISINRFRPNLVFSKGSPFEEDQWGDFNIGDVEFYGVNPCARCIVTTINQETAKKSKEPLKTLSTFRNIDNKIYVGLNATVKKEGMISVGDNISVFNNK